MAFPLAHVRFWAGVAPAHRLDGKATPPLQLTASPGDAGLLRLIRGSRGGNCLEGEGV